jgi:hypothetical protein
MKHGSNIVINMKHGSNKVIKMKHGQQLSHKNETWQYIVQTDE